MKIVVSWIIAVSLSACLVAQTPHKARALAKRVVVTADDIKALRDALAAQSSALAAQQEQILQLKQQLQRRDQAWQQSQQQLQSAQATATDAQSKAAALENVCRHHHDELLEILARSLSVEHYRRQLAWMKQERLRYGRIHLDDDAYLAFLEQGAGVALEDAADS